MANHSSILAWRTLMDREAWEATVHRVSVGHDWSNLACMHACMHFQATSTWHQFSSLSSVTLCDPMIPGLPVQHQLPESTQTHVHWFGDAIQPAHPLLSPFPPTFNHFQHQGLFKWVSSSHQVTKVLKLLLQHQSFQWIFRVDFL